MKRIVISSKQVIGMLVISRIVRGLTQVFRGFYAENTIDMVLIEAIGFAIDLLIAIPIVVLENKNKGQNIVSIAATQNNAVGNILKPLYFCYFLYLAAREVAFFNLFITSTSMLGINPAYFSILIVIAAVYVATMGIEPIARTSGLFVYALFFGIAFIFAMLIRKMDVLNFTPFDSSNLPKDLFTGGAIAFRGVEVIMLGFIAPFTNKKVGKIMIKWAVYCLIAIDLCVIGTIAILGDATSVVQYPMNTVATMVKSGVIYRLDSIFAAIWIGVLLCKCSLLIFISLTVVKNKDARKVNMWLLSVSAVSVAIVSNIFSLFPVTMTSTASIITDVSLFAFFAVIVPLVVIVMQAVNKHNKDKVGKIGGVDSE